MGDLTFERLNFRGNTVNPPQVIEGLSLFQLFSQLVQSKAIRALGLRVEHRSSVGIEPSIAYGFWRRPAIHDSRQLRHVDSMAWTLEQCADSFKSFQVANANFPTVPIDRPVVTFSTKNRF